MDNNSNKAKNKITHQSKKDFIDLHSELLYKQNGDEVGVEEVYYEPSIPGKLVGDC